VNHFNKTYKELQKVDKDVIKIANEESVVSDFAVLEKPDIETH
jgi:hypothetical protein